MAVNQTPVSGELFTHSPEFQRLTALWQALSLDVRAEIERRAKANGFSLMDQLRFSFPSDAPLKDSRPPEPPKARTEPPHMADLVRALDDLIQLMKQP